MDIDNIWIFKNFSMGHELDIAGEFIYESAKRMMGIQSLHNEFEINSILYNGAVGIERLQKILLCLYCIEKEDDLNHPIKCLLEHNHNDLQSKIQEYVNCGFNGNHNCLLDVFRDYYNDYRYGNYMINRKSDIIKLLERVFKRKNKKLTVDELLSLYDIGEYIKFFINLLGQIARVYYNLISARACELNMYTYELDSLSNAARVFLSVEQRGLYGELLIERLSMKEFLLFLRKSKSDSGLFRFMEDIEPFNYDSALINDYICELTNNRVDDYLVGETEAMYEELAPIELKKRMKIVDLIGNKEVFFDEDQ